MLIRHARGSSLARYSSSSADPTSSAGATAGTKKNLPSWLETKGRTRSLLFDEGNPVINKEAHKLHKVHLSPGNAQADPQLARVLEDDNVQTWQTNPYLSMLASPIRRCVWSGKAMPNEFLIAIKAATYEVPVDDPSKGSIPRTASTIFPRGLLHPAFSKTDESRGRKEDRGYVVCRKSALNDYNVKGGKRDHLETTGGANPFLIYQTESFLRQRILQELKLIAGLHHTREEQEGQEVFSRKMSEAVVQLENQHDQLFSLSKRIAERFRMKKSISFDDMVDTSTDPPQAQEQQQKVNIPAALLDFSHIGKSSLVPEGRVSSLLPYQTECLEEISLRNLSKHRIPVYSLQRIFQLDSQEEDESKTMSKNGPQDNQGTSWSILERKYPAVFEREAKACQNQLNDFNQTIISLIPSIQSEQNLEGLIVAVPSMSRTMLPLLKSLWRYRMWTGEGWSGDGFGVLEATGRK